MTAVSPLDGLSKAEMLFLLKRWACVDDRDIATCRWEMADAERKRLQDEAWRLESLEVDAIIALQKAPESRSLRAKQLAASMASLKAKNSADRATRKADARYADLQKFHLTRAK